MPRIRYVNSNGDPIEPPSGLESQAAQIPEGNNAAAGGLPAIFTFFAWMYGIFSGFGVLVIIAILLSGKRPDWDIFILFICVTATLSWVWYSVTRLKTWAFYVASIQSVLGLAGFPIGTLIFGFALYYLLQSRHLFLRYA